MSDSSPATDLIARLEAVIRDRKLNAPQGSYVAGILEDAPGSLCAKLVEEAYEVVEATLEEEPKRSGHLVHEAADVVFHLLVILGWANVSWNDVLSELERRFGASGNRGLGGETPHV